MPTRALAIKMTSSVSTASSPELSIASNVRRGISKQRRTILKTELGHCPLPQFDHTDMPDDPRQSRHDTEHREDQNHRSRPGRFVCELDLDERDQRNCPRRRQRLPRSTRRPLWFATIAARTAADSSTLNLAHRLFQTFEFAGKNLGELFDAGSLHDRVVVAGEMMRCDAPERQGVPVSRERSSSTPVFDPARITTARPG